MVRQSYSQQEIEAFAVNGERTGCAGPGRDGITQSYTEQHAKLRQTLHTNNDENRRGGHLSGLVAAESERSGN